MAPPARRDLGIPVHETRPVTQMKEGAVLIEGERVLPVPGPGAGGPGTGDRGDSDGGTRRGRERAEPRREGGGPEVGPPADPSQTRRRARDPVEALRSGCYAAQSSYLESLRRSGVLDRGAPVPKVRTELSQLHQSYVSMMVLQCMKPLKEGVSAESVLTTVSMATMMYLLSPNFRTQVGSSAKDVRSAITSRIAGREAREAKTEALGERGLARAGSEGKDSLSGRWRARVERMEHMQRGYREPFTEHSAALTHVGLTEAVYQRLRAPGLSAAGVQALHSRYESCVQVLYDYVDADGLDRQEMALHTRMIIGQRMDADPKFASTFAEIGNGRYTKKAPEQLPVTGTAETVSAWAGGFQESFGGGEIISGTFTLRPVQDQVQHRSEMARSMLGEMSAVCGTEDLGTVMSQYLVGSVTRAFPGAVERVPDPAARSRMARSRAMFSSMADDGIDEQDQKLLYMGAYIDAVAQLVQDNPAQTEQWAASFGPDWRAGVRETMERYAVMSEQGPSRTQGFGSATGDQRAWQDPYSSRSKDHEEDRGPGDADQWQDEVGDLRASATGPEASWSRRRAAQRTASRVRQTMASNGEEVLSGWFETSGTKDDQPQPGG